MTINIWFNRWFSTAYHFINMIKNNPDGMDFKVYGTHPNVDSVYLQVCDYVEKEPELENEEYIDYCLSFCQRNKIDIFIPRKNMKLISKYISDFNLIGTKVLTLSDWKLIETLEDKASFYELIEKENIVSIPDYHIVTNAEQFKVAYEDLNQKGHRVCFKPVIGEGGSGFRVVEDSVDSIESLFAPISHKVSFQHTYDILSKKDSFPELMVLEYLDGYEYSIDCLANNGELLVAVPRKKAGGRVRFLEENLELIEIAKRITETYKLSFVFNIQVKYKDGIPKLLEINPRMSGGLHISSLTGINFPYLAVKLLLQEELDVLKPNFNIKATQLEKEMVMTQKRRV